MQKWFPIALLATLFFILYGKIATHVGFLSDDWELILKAPAASIWLPLEKYHFSILINILFKGAANGTFSPFLIHILALIFHFANCLLVYLIAHSSLNIDSFKAWILTFLFAINPAGLEALAWCCAIGYVACAFWTLLGLYLFLQYLNQKWEIKHPFWFQVMLIVIQFNAFLCWDWGITMTPSLIIAAIFYSNEKEKVPRFKMLAPVLVFFILMVAFKKMLVYEFAHSVNTPMQMIQNIVASPFLGLFPQFTHNFYVSPFGMVMAGLTFAILLISCTNRKTLLLFVLFFTLLSPQIVMGYPQSRYFYLPMFALYGVVLLFLDRVAAKSSIPTIASLAWVSLLFTHLFWTHQRTVLWKEAYVQAHAIDEELKTIAKKEKNDLLLVNLPDRYGPEGMIWLPFVWRCGYNQFPFTFDRINTPDCHNLHANSGWAIVPREEILDKYPEYAPYEVFFNHADNYRDYEIKPLKNF